MPRQGIYDLIVVTARGRRTGAQQETAAPHCKSARAVGQHAVGVRKSRVAVSAGHVGLVRAYVAIGNGNDTRRSRLSIGVYHSCPAAGAWPHTESREWRLG